MFMISLGLVGLARPGSCAAVTTAAHGGHLIRIWQTEDRLPQNTVMAITQTRDGYLWVGTYAGLARFDGEHFHTFDLKNTPVLRDERIACLYEDTRGTLWIGNESGQVTCYRDGRFEAGSADSPAQERIFAFTEDERGTVWLVRQNGVLESVGQSGPVTTPPTGSQAKLFIAHSRADRSWICVNGVAAELKQGAVHPLDFGAAVVTGYVRGLGAATDGGLWVVRDGRIRKWMDGRWAEDRGAWGNTDITSLIELRNGALAIGTMDAGVHLLFPDGRTLIFDHKHGSIQNWVRSLYEDREGNLWVAGGSGGLAMVRQTAFGVLNPPDNWQGRTVLSVAAAKDGTLWVGTEGAGVYHYHDGDWTHYDQGQGLTSLYVWSIAVDPKGQVWAGTWNHAVFRLEGERFEQATELGPIGAPVLALHFDAADRSLWVGTRNGLLQWRDGAAIWRLRHPGDVETVVSAVASDARGAMWLALQKAGLGRLSAAGIDLFDREGGLATDTAQCLLADGDTLWIGTQNGGLCRLKNGRFFSLETKMNLGSRVICHIEDDGHGYLWMSTHRGIVRVAKRELNRGADGESETVPSETFDKNDGLPTLEYSGGLQAAGCQSGDGRLWFTSNQGLVCVDPAALPLNPLPPPVMVESMRVDGRLFQRSGIAPAESKVPPAHERIEFDYTALSLGATSKVLFKYQLHGLDKDWIEAGDKRTAFYSHLPPGEYRFQVIACNNDGVWNTTGDSLRFMVEPFFWQAWWFRSLTGLLAAATVGLVVRHETRRRMQHRFDELKFEHGIERERARIAQDIHDDIGSTLTRISMLSQLERPELEQPGQAAIVLERIHDAALEVSHTVDEIVWAVNPLHDSLDSMACYISRFAQEVLAEAGIACRISLPMNLPPWRISAQVRHNVLLAFKEVLNNILKHAKATEVKVSLVILEAGFVMTVQDNGQANENRAKEAGTSNRALGGNGLVNVHQRLAQIGGRCEIRAASGEGWCVDFIVESLPSALVSRAAL